MLKAELFGWTRTGDQCTQVFVRGIADDSPTIAGGWNHIVIHHKLTVEHNSWSWSTFALVQLRVADSQLMSPIDAALLQSPSSRVSDVQFLFFSANPKLGSLQERKMPLSELPYMKKVLHNVEARLRKLENWKCLQRSYRMLFSIQTLRTNQRSRNNQHQEKQTLTRWQSRDSSHFGALVLPCQPLNGRFHEACQPSWGRPQCAQGGESIGRLCHAVGSLIICQQVAAGSWWMCCFLSGILAYSSERIRRGEETVLEFLWLENA